MENKVADKDVCTHVKAAQAGDRSAFSKLVQLNQRYLRAFIASRTEYTQDVDDLAQEAFILAYENLKKINDPAAFRSWISGIALNLIRNHRRKHLRSTPHEPDIIQELLDTQQLSGSISTEDAIDFTGLSGCFLKLEPDQQAILRDHYVEGFSVKQLCEKFTVKHSTMTMRLYRCREWLRDCIIKQQQGESE
ncbi:MULTISPECIES: RNA polymerase sigma factor [unclassified Cellvibrio]|uniref:RNA polymerase sigma factor n=1 Tax=unclassified Cellvibrio TaxID=2624793 RepID=UPI00066FD9B4|nr:MULTISPECIES: sigma-70 family RNA polymerase sigma factor [unclassified Cellvibrio]QEY14915.1 sigma-70 family RNA polymerase sigma factor [Cellvibrio sp. KY-GH-1]UUA73809.1 sigma-70 family RNA polymerase sigma factor [Cellvibrio sp. QJXJ]